MLLLSGKQFLNEVRTGLGDTIILRVVHLHGSEQDEEEDFFKELND